MTIPLLLGLGGAAPASAQGLVEYALILVLIESPGTVVDDFQVPTALEEDCLVDPDASPLCDVLDVLPGLPAAEAMAILAESGAVLEETGPAHPAIWTDLNANDCGITLSATGRPVTDADLNLGLASSRTSKAAAWHNRYQDTIASPGATYDVATVNALDRFSDTRRKAQGIDWFFELQELEGEPKGSDSPRTNDAAAPVFEGGQNAYTHARPASSEPMRCADRLQERLEAGEALILPELLEESEAEALPRDRWVFTYSHFSNAVQP